MAVPAKRGTLAVAQIPIISFGQTKYECVTIEVNPQTS